MKRKLLIAALVFLPQAGFAAGLHEIDDSELAGMRGRFTLGDNSIVWFGVNMISTWHTASGETLQGSLALDMDFSHGTPRVSFTPHVSITSGDDSTATASSGRQVDSSGVANASGWVQSVQVAGDGNRASNHTTLTIRDGQAPATANNNGTTLATAIGSDGSNVTASYTDGQARLRIDVPGQGALQQWIQDGSVGQSIALAGDAQQVSNQLQIELVRQASPAQAPLAQNLAQSLSLMHGIGNR